MNFTLLPSLAPPDYGAYARVIVEERVPVVETAGRNPGEWIAYFKKHGVTVVHKCVAIKHALTAGDGLGGPHKRGRGSSAPGTPARTTSARCWCYSPKPPSACACRTSRPGIGQRAPAGGVPRGQARKASTWARGSWPRRRHPVDGIEDGAGGDERSTTLVMKSVGNTERVYRNAVAEEVRAIEAKTPGKIEAIRHSSSLGRELSKSFQETGDPNTSVWSAGIVMGLIRRCRVAREFRGRMVADAEAIITKRLPSVVVATSRL